MPWFAVMTKPGRAQWDLAVRSLIDEGIEVYAPICCEADIGRRRSLEARTMVMFPWYLLVWKPSRNGGWRDVEGAWGVDYVLRSSSRAAPHALADAVVDELRGRANREGVIELVPRFNPGQGLRISRGVFAGFEGVISRKAGKRVHVLLSLLGGPREVEVAEHDAEPVGQAAAMVAA